MYVFKKYLYANIHTYVFYTNNVERFWQIKFDKCSKKMVKIINQFSFYFYAFKNSI